MGIVQEAGVLGLAVLLVRIEILERASVANNIMPRDRPEPRWIDACARRSEVREALRLTMYLLPVLHMMTWHRT